MASFKQIQNLYRNVEEKAGEELRLLEENIQRTIDKYTKRFKADADGKLLNTNENRALRLQMKRELDQLVKSFTTEHFGDQRYWDSLLTDNPKAPQQGKLFADASEAAAHMSGVISDYTGLDDRVIIADQLAASVERLTTHYSDQFTEANRIIQLGLSQGNNYKDMVNSLVNAGFKGGPVKGTPAHGQTVLQGVVMETYRSANVAIADEIETDYFQMAGPLPMQGKNGHRMCQNHYMEIHTRDEWIEIAQRYAGEAGLIPEMIFTLGNGYGCRHTYDPVPVSQVKEAKQDSQAVLNQYETFKQAQAELAA